MPAFCFASVHQMAPLLSEVEGIWWGLLLIYRPRRDERLSWPGWLTHSGWLTHISGYTIGYRSSAGQWSPPAKRPTLYRYSTQPTTFWSNFSKKFSFGGPIPLSLHWWESNLAWRRGLRSPCPCQISPPSVQHVAPAGRKTSKSASEYLKYRRFALRAMLTVNYSYCAFLVTVTVTLHWSSHMF